MRTHGRDGLFHGFGEGAESLARSGQFTAAHAVHQRPRLVAQLGLHSRKELAFSASAALSPEVSRIWFQVAAMISFCRCELWPKESSCSPGRRRRRSAATAEGALERLALDEVEIGVDRLARVRARWRTGSPRRRRQLVVFQVDGSGAAARGQLHVFSVSPLTE